MNTYKATSIVFWRDQLRQLGGDVQGRVHDLLDDEARAVLEHSLPMTWLDVRVADRILGAVCQVLYPGDAQGLYVMGQRLARDNLAGIYRVLLSVTTVAFAIKQAARLWGTYHQRGQARVEMAADGRGGVFAVRGYPELPANVRHNISGYIAGVLEVARASGVRITERFDDPHDLRWEARWS